MQQVNSADKQKYGKKRLSKSYVSFRKSRTVNGWIIVGHQNLFRMSESRLSGSKWRRQEGSGI